VTVLVALFINAEVCILQPDGMFSTSEMKAKSALLVPDVFEMLDLFDWISL